MARSGVTRAPRLAAAAPAPFNAYLLALLAAAAWGRRTPPPPAYQTGELRFLVIVPAHDEETSVGATLASLEQLDYPPDLAEVVVIADSCSDQTAQVARRAGAVVWERWGEGGKGGAIAWALARLASERPEVEAVILVDADCTVAPNLLSAIEVRLRTGASVVQVANEVANTGASSAAALRHASFALINVVRPLGKATLGLSAGLFGTGMALSRELLERVPWSARSLLEDQEYHLELVAHGERVAFAPETWVRSAMPTSLRGSRSQQLRWDAGRGRLIRSRVPGLLGAGLRGRNAAQLHAAFEPFVPPQSVLLAANVASAALALRGSRATRCLGIANLAAQTGFVAGGLALTRAPAPVWRALASAPALALWKLGLLARLCLGRGPGRWVRTPREPSTDQAPAAMSGRVERPEARRSMRRSWPRRTKARSSGSARGARRSAASAQPTT
jgi:1,2-diacylglycerol 3-beta-glucosyltransferase